MSNDTSSPSCSWHSGVKSDISHLNESDRDQWDAIGTLRNKLDRQTWLLIATLAGIITQLLMQVFKCVPFILFFALSAHAADVTLSLNPNSTTVPAGYKLYAGTVSKGPYPIVVPLGSRVRDIPFTVTIPELESGKIYYFVATAYDENKNESSFSAEVSKAVPLAAPTINGVEITVKITVEVK